MWLGLLSFQTVPVFHFETSNWNHFHTKRFSCFWHNLQLNLLLTLCPQVIPVFSEGLVFSYYVTSDRWMSRQCCFVFTFSLEWPLSNSMLTIVTMHAEAWQALSRSQCAQVICLQDQQIWQPTPKVQRWVWNCFRCRMRVKQRGRLHDRLNPSVEHFVCSCCYWLHV